MRHPGKGSMYFEVGTPHHDDDDDEHEKQLERTCLMQWSIYCLNKYHTYKLVDGLKADQQTLRDYHMAQYLLYGWDPQHNLLEVLVGVSSNKLTEPVLKLMELKLQSNPDAFPLKSIQHVISVMFRKRNCLAGIKLIELVKKYHVNGSDLFKPEVKCGRGLLHWIFCMNLPLVAMEEILQHVTSDDLLHVMNVERDKVTVLTLGLYSNELTNEFLLKLIEKQPMLAHLPNYDDDDESKSELPLLGKRSLLHYVVSDMKRWELIPILIDTYGCDLNVKDLSGRTPRDVAILLNDWYLSLSGLPPCLQ